MKYQKVEWFHEFADEPVVLYSEIDEQLWETGKVEVFADGRRGFASATEESPATRTYLSEVEMLPIGEINEQSEFKAIEISKEDFEAEWRNRT